MSYIQATFNAPLTSFTFGNVTFGSTPISGNTYQATTIVASINNFAFYSNISLTSVTIPSTVTSIGSNAFSNCTGLTSVIISSPSIGTSAFQGCAGLTSVEIKSTVTSIGSQAFYYCTGLISFIVDSNNSSYSSDTTGVLFNYAKTILIQYPAKSNSGTYIIPSTVTSIGNYAFYNCTGLTSVTIPSTVTSIGTYAFYNCKGLTSVTIPSTVTSIGTYAFYNCTGLTSVTIPSSVTSFGTYAFYNCTGLTSATISSPSIGPNAFQGCTGLISVTIQSTVTSIGSSAFYNCTSLTSVTIQVGVTSIGSSAFYNCTSLTSVIIPSTVTSIGSQAFYNCTSLTSFTVESNNSSYSSDTKGVLFNYAKTILIQYPAKSNSGTYIIPSTVTSIGTYAFYNCKGLTSVTIPSTVTSIGTYAFYNCTGLTSVTIPSSVTSFGTYAFYNCTGLTSATISSPSIGPNAFQGCTGLISVTIQSTVTSIGSSAFQGCTSLTSVIIPSTVTSIGSSAFYNCTSLTSVNIPVGFTSIGTSAFQGCTSLTSVIIPSTVTSIGSQAFQFCTSLTSVIIPSTVTSIGSQAFYNCTGLTSFTVESNNSYYSSDTKGVLFNYAKTTLIQYPAKSNSGTYIIPSTVTSIDAYAFYNCTGLTSVTIPSSVTSINLGAFYGCTGLTSATIPSTVKILDLYAFYNCTGLTSATISSSSINDAAFYNCIGLTSVTIQSTVTSIGISAFQGCTGLTSVTISCPIIRSSAFQDCISLTSVTIKSTVTSISSDTFLNCTGLTSFTVESNNSSYSSDNTGVLFNYAKTTLIQYPAKSNSGTYIIPSTVTSIGTYAFNYCTGLTSVTIPSSVTSIGSSAFYGCAGLTSIVFADPSNITSFNMSTQISNITLTSLKTLYLPASVTSVTIPSGYSALKVYTASASKSCYTSLLSPTKLVDSVTYNVPYTANWSPTTPTTINGLSTGTTISLGSLVQPTTGTTSVGGNLTVSSLNPGTHLFTSQTTSSGYGTFTITTLGAWTYTTLSNKISAGVVLPDSFNVTAQDGSGDAATVTVTINVKGNSPPTITGSTGALLTQGNVALTASGELTCTDPDLNQSKFSTSVIHKSVTYGSLTITELGQWNYTMNGPHKELTAGQVVYDVFTVTSFDGTASQDITITITGINDPATITGTIGKSLTQGNDALTASGELTCSDIDSGENKFSTSVIHKSGTYGSLTITELGQWNYTMNVPYKELTAGQVVYDVFTVTSFDGTASQDITITITGINDPPTITGTIGKSLTQGNDALTASGELTCTDPDLNQSKFSTSIINKSVTYGSLTITELGQWNYTMNGPHKELTAGQVVYDVFTVTSFDGTASQDITITITGINDPATITGTIGKSLTQGNDALTASGELTCSDIDSGENKFRTSVIHKSGTYGSLTITELGQWNYTMNGPHKELTAGQVVYDVFTVTSFDGTASQDITITITGVNDPPTFTEQGNNKTASTLNVGYNGSLFVATQIYTCADPDAGDSSFKAVSTPTQLTYGKYTLTTQGVFTYTLDPINTNASVYTDSVTIYSYDNTSFPISIKINPTTIIGAGKAALTRIGFDAAYYANAMNNGIISDYVTCMSNLLTVGGFSVNDLYNAGLKCVFALGSNTIAVSGYTLIKNYIYASPINTTNIASNAFSNAINLTSIIIPSTVTSIGTNAFARCTSLTSISVQPGNLTYWADSYGVLFNYAKTQLLQCPGGFNGSYTIPNTVTSISSGAFLNCTSLTSISVQSGNLSYWADSYGVLFNYAGTQLIQCPGGFNGSYTIPNTVTSISSGAFASCTRLNSVSFPSLVNSISSDTFLNCTSLTSISVDSGNLSYWGDSYGVLFNYDKTQLIQCPEGFNGSYTIPNTVTSINSGAFARCSRLTSVSIPSLVNSISSDTFLNCTSLTSISVQLGNLTYWADSYGVLFNYAKTQIIQCPEGFNGSYTIPSSCISIGLEAFARCTRLTSVSIPSTVTSIGDYAFSYCTNLISCDIPSSVTSIGANIFAGDIKLKSTNVSSDVIFQTIISSSSLSDIKLSGNVLVSLPILTASADATSSIMLTVAESSTNSITLTAV